jgi:hypothetical protein
MRHGLRAALRMVPLLLFCFAAAPSDAQASKGRKAPLKRKPPVVLPRPTRVAVSIPYPNAGMYLHRGIYGSFAGGRSLESDSASGDDWQDPLFQWQGEVGYFYTNWFSGGAAFRINAGSPSDSQQTVRNRYYAFARVHKAFPRAAGYLGARIGVDDVNFSLRSEDTTLTEPLRETNAALGLEAGAGWKFSRYVGLTLGQRMDASLVRQGPDNPNRSVNFLTQPGLAFDLLRVYPSLETNVKAFYLLTELQFGQSLAEEGEWNRQFAWIAGLSLAF